MIAEQPLVSDDGHRRHPARKLEAVAQTMRKAEKMAENLPPSEYGKMGGRGKKAGTE